jgi:hypothetical protein
MEIVDNDLSFGSRVVAPTVKIRRTTVAGQQQSGHPFPCGDT